MLFKFRRPAAVCIFACIAAFLLSSPATAASYRADVVLLPAVTGSRTADAVAQDCVTEIRYVLEMTGRLYPETLSRSLALFPSSSFDEQKVREAYEKSGIRRYWIVTVNQDAARVYAVLNAVDAGDSVLKTKTVKVSSGIIQNLSLLLAREVALSIAHMDIHAAAESAEGTRSVIAAGQWHGISEGSRYPTSAGEMTVEQTSRFSSIVRFSGRTPDSVVVFSRPRCSGLLADIDERIRLNIERTRGTGAVLLKEEPSPEKRLLVSTLVINSGASLCLPGYGSFLSVSYMGFQDPKPSFAGIFAGCSAELVQLCTVPAMSGEKAPKYLVPWTERGDRTRQEFRLQRYLWGTIPLTWGATYFDQLAVQYSHERVVPPGFADANRSAAAWSLLIPGGGLYYKGYRGAGWGYYSAEMLAGAAAAHYGMKRNGKIAIGALAALKMTEIVTAYLIPPSYSFYNREYERENRTRFEISLSEDDLHSIRAAVVTRF